VASTPSDCPREAEEAVHLLEILAATDRLVVLAVGLQADRSGRERHVEPSVVEGRLNLAVYRIPDLLPAAKRVDVVLESDL
jgi:hypothetical protein